MEQQVAHANEIVSKPRPAANEIVAEVDQIVMPAPVPTELSNQDN